MGRDVLPDILKALGANVISLGRTDVFVPIDTEAVRHEDIQQAREWADLYDFDAILSTDGDADRPLIGDEKGNWLRGDVVGILCAQYLRATAVVTPVSSNSALEKTESFAQVIRTRIGSPYVIEGMQTAAHGSAGLVVGYEANGGFLLGSQVLHDEKRLRTKVRGQIFIVGLAVNIIKDAVKVFFIKLAESLGILPRPLKDRILVLYFRLGHA